MVNVPEEIISFSTVSEPSFTGKVPLCWPVGLVPTHKTLDCVGTTLKLLPDASATGCASVVSTASDWFLQEVKNNVPAKRTKNKYFIIVCFTMRGNIPTTTKT